MTSGEQHTKPNSRRILIRLGIILPIVLVLSGFAWYGVNKLVASRLPVVDMAMNGDVEGLAYVNKWQPARLREPAKDGWTLLESIAWHRNINAVRTYEQAGGDLYMRDAKGETLIHRMVGKASWNGHSYVTLANAGVDVNAKANDGRTPYDVAGSEARIYLGMVGGKSGFIDDIDRNWLSRLIGRWHYAKERRKDYLEAMKSVPIGEERIDMPLPDFLEWLKMISPKLTSDGKPLTIRYPDPVTSGIGNHRVRFGPRREIDIDVVLRSIREETGLEYDVFGQEVDVFVWERNPTLRGVSQFTLDTSQVKLSSNSVRLSAHHIRCILVECGLNLEGLYGVPSRPIAYDVATSVVTITSTPRGHQAIVRVLQMINDWENGVDPPKEEEPEPLVIEVD